MCWDVGEGSLGFVHVCIHVFIHSVHEYSFPAWTCSQQSKRPDLLFAHLVQVERAASGEELPNLEKRGTSTHPSPTFLPCQPVSLPWALLFAKGIDTLSEEF